MAWIKAYTDHPIVHVAVLGASGILTIVLFGGAMITQGTVGL